MLESESSFSASSDYESLHPLVGRVFDIEDITTGVERKDRFVLRYRGRVRGNSAEAYDWLADRLRPLGFTPLFRQEQGQHVVLLMPGVIDPRPSNPWINLLMGLLTLLSVLFAGALYGYEGPVGDSLSEMLFGVLRRLPEGIPFAFSLLAILVTHEFGHYLAGRYHNTHVTLPYFIPFPLSPFGTMGAFIQLKEPPKNKRILLDIGLAGPLAGLAVAIPMLLYGLSLSEVGTLSSAPGQVYSLEGNSLLYLLSKYLMFGQWLPAPSTYGNINPVMYWLRYFFTGQPLPLGGMDVLLHPVAWGAWAGLLVTALNLIPAGQLDGGHAAYVLLGGKARLMWPFILGGLVLFGFVWPGWWLWAFLIFVLGRVYAEPLDQITALDGRRRWVAVFGLVVFILVFIPVPLIEAVAGM